MHQNVFRAHNFDKPTFAQLVGQSRLHGIGQDEPLLQEGILRHDHGDLCILISGGLTVYYQDVLLHSIQPGQCINSVEWISMLRAPEETEDFGWEQQVCIRPNQDSMYLRLEKDHLENLKIHHCRMHLKSPPVFEFSHATSLKLHCKIFAVIFTVIFVQIFALIYQEIEDAINLSGYTCQFWLKPSKDLTCWNILHFPITPMETSKKLYSTPMN